MPRVSADHEQQVRERILDAALRVFAERGYHGATIQDVVQQSGLSVGAIYTYFSGKDELFHACCDQLANRSLEELGMRLAGRATTVERIAAAVALYFDSVDTAIDGGPGLVTLVQAWAAAETEPRVREALARRRERLAGAARLILEEGVARGDLPAWLDADATARGYLAMLDGLLLQRIEAGEGHRREPLERQARALLEVLLGSAATRERPAIPSIPARPYERARPPGTAPRRPAAG